MLEEPNYKRLFVLLSALFLSSLVLLSVKSNHSEKDIMGKKDLRPELATPVIFTPGPELKAQAYVVKITGEWRPVFSRREWKRLAPASLTKILTAVLARETLPADEKITFSEDAKKTEEKLSPAKTGDTFLRDEVIKLALVGSFNDAAIALAESIGKSRKGVNFEESLAIFKTLANEKAHLLGLQDSRFQNPTGLDEENHYSSAEDLAKLAEYVLLRHSDLWMITRQTEARVWAENGTEYNIDNTNELLKEFPAILGGKTGFTDNAKGALLFLYPVRPNKTVIVVILGSEDRFGDGRKIIQWLEENLNGF